MRKGWFFAACVAVLTFASNAAHAGGHVYALRGLINIFSYGMDDMVAKCKRRGIQASAHGHGEYPSLAIEAAAKVKSGKGPIIIIGHSYGADAAVTMAEEMRKLGAPVALLVLYGPTVEPLYIPSNVRAVMNYYQTSNAAWRAKAVPGPGFTGSINNINLDKADDVTHFNIEKLERLQNQAMTRIASLTGTGRPIPTDTPATTSASNDAATPPARGVVTPVRATSKPATTTGAAPSNGKPAARAPSGERSATATTNAPVTDANPAATPASGDAKPAATASAPATGDAKPAAATTAPAAPKPASKPVPKPAAQSATTNRSPDRLPSHGSF